MKFTFFLAFITLVNIGFAQKINENDFQLVKGGTHYKLKMLFIADRLDSVKLVISTESFVASKEYKNILWLNLNNVTSIEDLTDKILATIYNYDFTSANTNEITCSGLPCALEVNLPTDAEWTTFLDETKLFLVNKLNDIRRQLLTSDLSQGTIQIKDNTETRFLIFGYSLQKNANNEIYFSLIENATMNGNTQSSGLNSFERLYGETSEQISSQIFTFLKTAKSSSIYDNEQDFYNHNISVLNEITIQIKKMKGLYFDVNGVADRFGFLKVNNTIPIYVTSTTSKIDYEKVAGFYKKANLSKDELYLLKAKPLLPIYWKFVQDDQTHPNKGKFFLRSEINSENVIQTKFLNKVIDLEDDGNNHDYYQEANIEIGKLEIDSVDIQIFDGEIYSFSFFIKHTSLFPSVERFQYFNIRYPIKQLSKSLYNFYKAPYLYLNQNPDDINYSENQDFLIHPADVIFFDHPEQLSNKIFTAVDTVFRIRSTNNEINVVQKLREKGLLSIVDLDLFGDLIGFLDEGKPNGLIQSEVKFHWYLNRNPAHQQKPNASRFYYLNRFEFRLRASKIDNQNKYFSILNSMDGNEIKYVHTINLYKYQNSFVDLNLDLTNWDFGPISWVTYAKAGILRSNLQDSIITTSNNETIKTTNQFRLNSFKYSFGTVLHFFRTHDINIDLDVEALSLWPLKKSLYLSNSEYDGFSLSNNSFVPTTRQELLWDPKLVFTYNFDRTKSRRIIARGEFMWEAKQFGNNNFFLQIGYSADLNRFLNLNKPSNANF